ncbi:uncharacterized protein LOC143445788 [Clavelina lepadiformis]|uniref:uncharacterized protein LOC143445788 n=1 Tax=Clavelina lepadiformis TaxID=159417 RepID=UPI00404165B6
MSLNTVSLKAFQSSSKFIPLLTSSSANSLQKVSTTLKNAFLRSEGFVANSMKPTDPTAPTKILIPKQTVKSHATAASAPTVQASSSSCHPCTINDREEMIDFMCRLFVTREPLMRSIGATPTNSRVYVKYCIDEALVHNASFLSRDDDTGKICGVRLNAIGPASGHDLDSDFGPEMNIVPKFLHYMEEDIPKLLGTDRFMRHVAICVEPSVAQCGIATSLMKKSLKLAKTERLRHLTAMCSWKLPFQLATKMGFENVREVAYADYAERQRKSGEVYEPFEKLAVSEGAARMMVKNLPA